MPDEENGKWMKLKQIREAGSPLSIQWLNKKVNSDGKFKTRRSKGWGRPIEVLVTSKNISEFKIQKRLDFTEERLERELKKVSVTTDYGVYQVSSTEDYGFNQFSNIMEGVLPESESKKPLQELFELNCQREGNSKRIAGSKLIGLLVESKNAAFIGDKLVEHISREAGINIQEVIPTIYESARQHVKKLSDKLHYIPKENLPEVIKLVRKKIYGVEEWPDEIEFKKERQKTKEPETPLEETQRTIEKQKAKGFFIEIPGIFGNTKIFIDTGNDTTVKEIRNKVGGIEILVDSKETTPASMHNSTKRYTAQELSEMTGQHIATIRSKLKKYSTKFDLRRKDGLGRAYEAKITLENYHLIGISDEKVSEIFQTQNPHENPKPAKLTEIVQNSQNNKKKSEPTPSKRISEEPQIELEISGKNYRLLSSKTYNEEEILEVLKQVHQGIFTELTVNRIFEDLDIRGREMKGKELANYVGIVNGMMSLSSTGTQKKLEDMGISNKHLEEDTELSNYLRRAPGLKEPYILKQDLPEIEKIASKRRDFMKAHTPEEDKEEKAKQKKLQEWYKRLEKKGIMPRENTLEKLTSAGVLVTNSEESIRITFERFEQEMSGFKYFNISRIKDRLPGIVTWEKFREDYASRLIKAGVVKEIVQNCGGRENSQVYVVKEGVYTKDILELLGVANNSNQ